MCLKKKQTKKHKPLITFDEMLENIKSRDATAKKTIEEAQRRIKEENDK